MPLSLNARKVVTGWLLALAIPGAARAQLNFVTNGIEYSIAGTAPGDQVRPQLALGVSGGFLVWEDNITDGYGLGISALRLDSGFSAAFARFRVNVTSQGEQERPRVTLLSNGGAAFVWQGGPRSSQHIYARFLSSSNTWLSASDLQVNAVSNRFQISPVIALLTNGNVVVAYSSRNQFASDSMQDIYARILSPAGQKIGGEFLVNQFTTYNQRTPAVAGLSDGRFVITWVSEQERADNAVDIYARLFNADGTSAGNEFMVDATTNVCANPNLAPGSGGAFVITWDQRDLANRSNGWDIFSRNFGSTGVGGPVRLVNTFRFGDQFVPKISSLPTGYLIVWTSLGQDNSWEGVYGRFLDVGGNLSGGEFRVNTTTAGRQIHPVVANDGLGRFLVAWSGFTNVANGMDLYAQRYVDVTQPLPPMNPPFVWVPFLVSNGVYKPQIQVSWPVQSGYPVDHYELFVDGAGSPTANLTTNVWIMTASNGLTAASTHIFQVDFVTTTGRRSPLSSAASATTWSGNNNWGGIPSDWMSLYYGPDIFSWPRPDVPIVPGGPTLLQVFLTGANPLVPATWLRTSLVRTPQGYFLTWNPQPGLIYLVQSSANLASWTSVGAPRFAAGNTDSVYVGGNNTAYYRILKLY